MKLSLSRRYFTNLSTVGELYIDGKMFCHTLEDTCRLQKIPKITAIPEGTYRITIEPSPRYGRLMPRLKDVPGYSGILLHWGNRPDQTDGCILVGRYNEKVPNFISNSRKTFELLFQELASAATPDKWITIRGGRKAQV